MKWLLLAAALNVQGAQCLPYPVMAELLSSRFKETLQFTGKIGSQTIMNVYISEKGTFTITTRHVSGISCIRMAGDSMEFIGTPPVEGDPL